MKVERQRTHVTLIGIGLLVLGLEAQAGYFNHYSAAGCRPETAQDAQSISQTSGKQTNRSDLRPVNIICPITKHTVSKSGRVDVKIWGYMKRDTPKFYMGTVYTPLGWYYDNRYLFRCTVAASSQYGTWRESAAKVTTRVASNTRTLAGFFTFTTSLYFSEPFSGLSMRCQLPPESHMLHYSVDELY